MAWAMRTLKIPLLRKREATKVAKEVPCKRQPCDSCGPYGWVDNWALISMNALTIFGLAAALGPSEYSVESQTRLVVLSQLAFYAYGYLDFVLSGDLRWSHAHLSAMLDHDRRAWLCGMLTLVTTPLVVSLEASRPIPYWTCRVLLAGSMCLGLLLTCLIRESGWFAGHAAVGVLGFGSSLALVLISTLCHLHCGWTLLAASLLCVVTFITALLQFLKLSGIFHFPSWALGLGEASIVLFWGMAVLQLADA